jgi:hypothetical protein
MARRITIAIAQPFNERTGGLPLSGSSHAGRMIKASHDRRCCFGDSRGAAVSASSCSAPRVREFDNSREVSK